jgi:hypothetical protein
MFRLGIFNSSASKARRAAFAFPSTADARSVILIAARCCPITLFRFAFGTTWNRSVAIRQTVAAIYDRPTYIVDLSLVDQNELGLDSPTR